MLPVAPSNATFSPGKRQYNSLHIRRTPVTLLATDLEERAMPITNPEGTSSSRDGLRLLWQSWLPESAAKAHLVIVHGYAEHSGRYSWVGEQLAAAGIAVHAYDLRGHGFSEGEPVFVHTFKEHLDDLDLLLARVRAEAGAAPLFLFGHSMGGLIVTLYCAIRHRELAGLITSGAAISPLEGPLKIFGLIFAVVARVRPGAGVRSLSASTVSRDPAVVEAYANDPQVYHGKMPASTIAAIRRAIARVHQDMDTISLPLLVMHGTVDELVTTSGSEKLAESAISADKTLKLYEGLAHEILNEPEKEQVLADLRAWIEARA
jgi:acylglycerol lipase